MDEEVIEMDITELKEYIREHPDILIHITTEGNEDERSSD